MGTNGQPDQNDGAAGRNDRTYSIDRPIAGRASGHDDRPRACGGDEFFLLLVFGQDRPAYVPGAGGDRATGAGIVWYG